MAARNTTAEAGRLWEAALGNYLAAKSAEDTYDRDVYMPAFQRWNAAVDQHGRGHVPAGDLIPDEIEREIERLQSLRHDAEDAIMSVPSPDVWGFARKILVAYGEGRGANGWNEMLETEAKQFLSAPDSPQDDPAAAAWASYSTAYLGHVASTTNGEPYYLQHPWGVRCDEADDALTYARATSLAGLAGKLRRLFMQLNRAEWAERLALNVEQPGDQHSLELSDIYTRMMWGAVGDVERLAPRCIEAARDEWEQALKIYSDAHTAATRKGLSEEECAAASEEDSRAFRAMVATPAPDLAALHEKMEIGLAHVWNQCHAEPEEIAALLADVSRLGGE